MKQKDFITRAVLISNDGRKPMIICKPIKWEWDERDMVWYHQDTDERYYMERPKNGTKRLTLKGGYHSRLMVKDC